MSSIVIRVLLFFSLFINLDCEVHQERPSIITADGDLILAAGYNKNLFLRTNGPKSVIYIQGINLPGKNDTQQVPHPWSEKDPINTSEINDIDRRLRKLEERDAMLPASMLLNMTMVWRRINRFHTRIRALETLVATLQTDECQKNPCEHGGTCLNLASGYHCLCPSNWEGTNCDIDVNECRNFAGTDLGCQNGAQCINRLGSYECQCKSGWFGVHCTRKAKDCSGGNFEMCGYGTCVPTTNGEGITCICNQGWTSNGTGVACLTDVNECDSSQGSRCSVNPKVDCVNVPGSFRCGQCPAGYVGDGFSCSDIDECLTIPNGGCSTSPIVTCHNIIGSRICGPCPPGYEGDGVTCKWRGSCAIDHGGCHPSAQCIEGLGTVTPQCVCPRGMVGDGVGINGCYVAAVGNASNCETNPCGVHGRCHRLRVGYTCICMRGFGGAHCDVTTDYCAPNPCQNGGTCRADDSARGFRCECPVPFSGDHCQLHARPCGGVLDNEEGSIAYPLNNTTYKHNSRCAWVIHVDPDKVINVTFSKFNLEEDPECLYDFLQIHDGRSSASQLIGRFCGTEFPKGGNIISSHNNLYFWFRSDQSVAKDGFALQWTSIAPQCGGEVNATAHGRVSSPGSPGRYPPNRDCYWHLTTTLGKRLELHFFELDIETHANCSFDFVAIYDGERTTDPLLNKFCNSTQPAPVLSAGSDVLIHFHSDASGSGKGFQIAYAPIEGVPGCGGYYTTELGEITSPTYDGKYLNDLMCEYKIKTSPGTKIRLRFKSFNIESAFRCKYDYLKVYDGPSVDSPLVGRFCGRTYPEIYTSSSNYLFIKFKSDHSTAASGFKISYESVCQQVYFGDSGVIKSPGYPFTYPENKVCEYIISAPHGKAVELTFQDFDIEDNRYFNCKYDNVEVRDGPDVNSTFMGRYCGGSDHTPPVQTSTHNFLYVKFSSDLSVSGTGFYANYTTINAGCGGIYKENSATINHPAEADSTYLNDETCTWLLVAPPGMNIKLTWNRFDLELMPSCFSDYLELIEIDDNNENTLLGKYCGNIAPPALTTSSNRLMLKFTSDSSAKFAGFSVSYTFLDGSSQCGGLFVRTHGYIYSPGWPRPYQPNRDCTWTITVPVGQQILLNITQFELERPIRDKCDLGDYLDIRNGLSHDSPLIGRYCGSFQWKRIVSLSNTIYLSFHSDFYISGKGFKIEWDGTLTGCGGTLTSSSGSISSPNYPQPYNENAECFYKIVTNPGSLISISFVDLDLERTTNCMDDYVEIFDGRDVSAPSLGKHCYMVPQLSNIKTSSNYVYIKFRSDFYIGGKGFHLIYDTICQNNITGSYGIIESPDYPNRYRSNLNCLWTINVPKGNKINVTFTHFNVYRSYYRPWVVRLKRKVFSQPQSRFIRTGICDDYVQVKKGSRTDFSEKYCGVSAPPSFTSIDSSVQIKFITTALTSRTGFRLEWVKYGCGGHIQKTFGTLSLRRSETIDGEMECEWLLETTHGNMITITFTDLYMTESNNCTKDAIEIYNGESIKEPLLTKICHRHDRSSSTISSTSNFMLIRFIKSSSLNDVYFESHFSSYPAKCGGDFLAPSGFIFSKNYPKNYDNDLNCVWFITVPTSHRIEINFIDIDLFEDDDDECGDSIQIYDSKSFSYMYTNYSERICPNFRKSQIITKGNYASLRFISNSNGNAKGFKANFSMTCGATITATSPGFISNDKLIRHLNYNCTWIIVAPNPDQKISLTLTHMVLPKTGEIINNRKCPSSFLKIYDGNDETAPLIDEYCGNKIPPTIVSHGSAITVQMGTYTNIMPGHFIAHYNALNNACGGTLTSEEGTIASPNYPMSYPPETNCDWILKTSAGNRVYIVFQTFDVQYSDNCNEDYLEVRENNGAGKLLGVFCGNNVPYNVTAASRIYIKFHSDNRYTSKGFLFDYGFLHGNDITEKDSGELDSPLYPNFFTGSGEYTWRIMTKGSSAIDIFIDRLEIPVQGKVCYNSLSVYDGYNEEATLIEDVCGIVVTSDRKTLQTSSNVVYIKLKLDATNPGSLFHIRWSKSDKPKDEYDSKTKFNCGNNDTQFVSPGSTVNFHSPNYPNEYDNDINCEWIYRTDNTRHLSLKFTDFNLEETPGCFADSISVYSSKSLGNWEPIKENMCLSDQNSKLLGSQFIKIIFKTDFSVTRKGFTADLSSLCGGTITDLSGEIRLTWDDWQNIFKSNMKCTWHVKVRPGRLIGLKFLHFNITNRDTECKNYVIIRNGNSEESPYLGAGKFCGYTHEAAAASQLETSSNNLFISFKVNQYDPHNFQNFVIAFEEKNVLCGGTIQLETGNQWEVINSPNYPSVPPPYTECEWTITGPPGEILRVDFIDRFDLTSQTDCSSEFVEVRDGSSSLSPLKGRFCGEKPGTVKSTNHVVYLNYVTQLLEPRNGFKANISVDMCGGTIISTTGEISSPGYPKMKLFGYGSVCEWRIVGNPGRVFLIKPQDIDLPDSEDSCGTKITVEESLSVNNTRTVLKTICNDEIDDDERLAAIESTTNEVIIKLYIGKPDKWEQISERKGFRFTFNSSRPSCGGVLSSPEGYLTTPGYPRKTALRYCQWLITVPDKTRRIKVELLDYDKQRIGIYNDLGFQSVIQSMTYITDQAPTTRIFESSGNKLSLYIWLPSIMSTHRFQAKYDSNEPSLCGGSLNGNQGELVSPALDRSYTCEWSFNKEQNEFENKTEFNTIFVNVKINSSVERTRCRYSDPKLSVRSVVNNKGVIFMRELCSNKEDSFRIPASVMALKAIQAKDSSLYFHLDWKLEPCGGILEASENPINVINVPSNYNGTLDCAWVVNIPVGNRIEIKLEGDFDLSCEAQYIKVNQGFADSSSLIGDYCKDRMQDRAIISSIRYMYIQYHSSILNSPKIKLMVRTVDSLCGGILTHFDNTFSSPNYPKNYYPNQECTWEIKTYLGSRISLKFIERFVIEDRPNCTKDAVIVYDVLMNNNVKELARLCGRNLPSIYNSTFNQMKVVLRTDSEINLDGFKAIWTPICGGTFTATEKVQTLVSPGYPYEYTPSLDCTYKIKAPGQRILLKFIDFELEGSYPSCEFDNVTVLVPNSYTFESATTCGSHGPDVTRATDEVQIIFKTDRFIERKGFKLEYSIDSCHRVIHDPTSISSGLFNTYDDNMNCTWSIQAPENKVAIVKFLVIDLESSGDCYTDYVAIFSGLLIDNDKRLALLCGHINSTTVVRSSTNKMLIQFVTDSSLVFRGFRAEIMFSYSETVGCGGTIDLTNKPTYTLKAPLIGTSVVYENYLDCFWTIKAPEDNVIKVEFTSFHIAPCPNVNQTALGIQVCNCDSVEIRDGINPTSFILGTYCGHTAPPPAITSHNFMSIRLSTDGEITSSGFTATLSVQPSSCHRTHYAITKNVQIIKSPGYETGYIPRSLHCVYHFESSAFRYSMVHINVKALDLESESKTTNKCEKDRLIITNIPHYHNTSSGKDMILNGNFNDFFAYSYYFDDAMEIPNRFELCGLKSSIDFYVNGDVNILLQTSPEAENMNHKGVELEISFVGYCGRNYTESQGRIISTSDNSDDNFVKDCYTLISAPENNTISIYFLTITTGFSYNNMYLDIIDGNKLSDSRLVRIAGETFDSENSVFSTGRYLLLHNHASEDQVTYDLLFVTTDKGRGCGGKIHNEIGRVTSPLYPDVYRRRSTCEWDIETPIGTKVRLHFSVFDMGKSCEQNYLKLVDRNGDTISTYCSEKPADYSSKDNFIKIVFVTTMNNGGTGWVVEFIGLLN